MAGDNAASRRSKLRADRLNYGVGDARTHGDGALRSRWKRLDVRGERNAVHFAFLFGGRELDAFYIFIRNHVKALTRVAKRTRHLAANRIIYAWHFGQKYVLRPP